MSSGTVAAENSEPTYTAYPFDARAIAHRFRHSAIFGALDALETGDAYAGANQRFPNHDPIPLLNQMRERYGERVQPTYRQREAGAIVIDFVVVA